MKWKFLSHDILSYANRLTKKAEYGVLFPGGEILFERLLRGHFDEYQRHHLLSKTQRKAESAEFEELLLLGIAALSDERTKWIAERRKKKKMKKKKMSLGEKKRIALAIIAESKNK